MVVFENIIRLVFKNTPMWLILKIQMKRKRLILKDFRELQSGEAEADVEPWVASPSHQHASHQRNSDLNI